MFDEQELIIDPLLELTNRWEDEGGSLLPQFLQLSVDEDPHNGDGILLRGWDGATPVRAFISRRVIDDWAGPMRPVENTKSLFRDNYNELGKRNISAIERIVGRKYRRGPAFNRQHPFVDVLLADITESGEVLDLSETPQALQVNTPSKPTSRYSYRVMMNRSPRSRTQV